MGWALAIKMTSLRDKKTIVERVRTILSHNHHLHPEAIVLCMLPLAHPHSTFMNKNLVLDSNNKSPIENLSSAEDTLSVDDILAFVFLSYTLDAKLQHRKTCLVGILDTNLEFLMSFHISSPVTII